jgi:hypothetical protein
MIEVNDIILWALAGGIIRVLIGFTKQKGLEFNLQKAMMTIMSVLLIGVIAALLIKPEEPLIAFFAGFGGTDFLGPLYKFFIKKRIGFSPEITSYGLNLGGPTSAYPKGLTKHQRKAWDYICRFGSITNQEYQNLNKVDKSKAASDLKKMVTLGILKRIGSGTAARYVAC